MVMKQSVKLLKKYGTCPLCGSDRLGKGEGTLVVKDKLFSRTCKCGWSILIGDKK